MRKLAIFFILSGILASVGWFMGADLPTLSWFFETSETFGYSCSALVIILGVLMFLSGKKSFDFKPMTIRRWQRFKSIRRGYWSFILLIGLVVFAASDQLIVGKRALMVKHGDEYFFPAFSQTTYKNKDFGITGDTADSNVDYRELKKRFTKEEKGPVVMPFIPYDPTGDTITAISKNVEVKDGVAYSSLSGKKYNGLAAKLHFEDDPKSIHLRYKYRNGVRTGETIGKNIKRQTVYIATYKEGVLIKESYTGEGSKEDFLALDSTPLRRIFYNPSPSSYKDKHLLGTDSKGNDIFAYLYGGLQVNFKAALLYIPCVYAVGITVGLLMGYYGGTFDIIIQRIIEIFSNIPFLFVILILSGLIPEEFRGLGLILVILAIFGWMGMTYLMRTAALKEKARDYVAAARVMGATTPRIIFKHILPNSVAIIVTLVPFSVSAVVLALTSLDYLGFGLPPEYAAWGKLLQDGLANLSAPWIVASAFFMLVLILILVTFIGEAVREAFDPKKFTTYR